MLKLFFRLLSLTSVFLIVILLGLFIARPKFKDKTFENITYGKDFAINVGKTIIQEGQNNFPALNPIPPKKSGAQEFKKPEGLKIKEKSILGEKVKGPGGKPFVSPISLPKPLPEFNKSDSLISKSKSVITPEKFKQPREWEEINKSKQKLINGTGRLENIADNLQKVQNLEKTQKPVNENIKVPHKKTGNSLDDIPINEELRSQKETKPEKKIETDISKKKAEVIKRNERLVSIFEKLETASRRLEGR